MGAVMAAWLAEIGIIAVRDLTGPKRIPLPSELLATFVVFGGLGLVSESDTARGPAAATAWGLVIATLLSARVGFLKPVGDFLAGTAGTSGSPGLNQQFAAGLLPPATGSLPATPGPLPAGLQGATGDVGNILSEGVG